jgi:small subunit ribosomal protein S2
MDMALPDFSMRQLLEAGVHFGHQTQRWNPRMAPYIYGDRNGIHIIDLTQTVPMLDAALKVIRDTVAKGGRILFVGTKRQAQKPIADAAEKCAQYYMNHRWLGGTLTNWKTVSQSIARLKEIDELMAHGAEGLTKKERLGMERDQQKLQASLGGIREMGGVPDLLFVIDVNKEDLAILEAASSASRSWPSSTPTARPTASTTSSPATMTPRAPSRSTATSSPARRSTACRPSSAPRASTSARSRSGRGRWTPPPRRAAAETAEA